MMNIIVPFYNDMKEMVDDLVDDFNQAIRDAGLGDFLDAFRDCISDSDCENPSMPVCRNQFHTDLFQYFGEGDLSCYKL